MNKYVVLAVLPLLASCASMKVKRPSRDAADQTQRKTDEGLNAIHSNVDQVAMGGIDTTEDTAAMGGNIGRNQTRRYARTGVHSTRRGSRIVAQEGRAYMDTGFDIADDGADLTAEQVDVYPNMALDASNRTMGVGGTLIGASAQAYGNAVERTRIGLGKLLGGIIVDTKPYMVGSANDMYAAGDLPGSGWKRPYPQVPQYAPAPAPAATSAKDVVDVTK